MIIVLPKADDEMWTYARYLAKRVSIRLAQRFLDAIQHTLEDLETTPGLGAKMSYHNPQLVGLRYYRINRFPNHFLFYREITPSTIELVRVIHGARNLKKRLKR